MLSEVGVKALLDFLQETDAIIVTVTMTPEEAADLEQMLVDWKERPTRERELEILGKYAMALPDDTDSKTVY